MEKYPETMKRSGKDKLPGYTAIYRMTYTKGTRLLIRVMEPIILGNSSSEWTSMSSPQTPQSSPDLKILLFYFGCAGSLLQYVGFSNFSVTAATSGILVH